MSNIGEKIGNAFVDGAETILSWLSGHAHQNLEDYCDLETADSHSTLVMRDGSLMSIVKVEGVRFLVGSEEFENIHTRLTNSLQAYMGGGVNAHALQFFFERDPESVGREIDRVMAPSVETAKRLNLNIEDVINDEKRVMASWCSFEKSYIALYTRPGALSKDAAARASETQKEAYKKTKAPFVDAQNPILANGELRDRHQSFVQALTSDMGDVGMLTRLLNVHNAVKAIRMVADGEFTDDAWLPYLPGDQIPARIAKNNAGRDISDLLWPKLPLQIFPRDAKISGEEYLTIGSRSYGTVFINLPQRDPTPFQVLFKRVSEYEMPWRVSFLVEGGGLKMLGLKNAFASFLAFSSNDNRLIADAITDLEERVNKLGEADIKLRISLSTWAPYDNEKLLKQRISQLARAVEGWGMCDVKEVTGDAAAGFVSSALGLTIGSVATPAAAPLGDVITQLPLSRPASPWNEGAVLFRTPDGKIWPYQPGSSVQDMWIDLIFARPGSGKSVLLNKTNLGLCMSPGIVRLPRIFIIDIGPSSSGLISLLKEALPAERRHEAMYTRLRMTSEYAINPCDTQLGCRTPTTHERAFLVNMLTLLTTPIGKESPYDGMPDMAGLVVDEMYKSLNDGNMPRPYSINTDEVVDKAITQHNIRIDRKTTWWEIVDQLFALGDTHHASLAQRYAVPMLQDAVAASHSEPIRNLFANNTTPAGEHLVDAFSRMISGAIREYPILASPTKFDLGDARVVSLDLDEVAKSGGDAADRQTAVMYMLARHMARDFYLNEGNLQDMNEKYREHHKVRISEIKEDIKRICMDEFHRTSKSTAVRNQVILDMREGRKWGVHVVLLSQSIDDFDRLMVEFATSIFILSAGPKQTVEKLTEVFGLSDTARFALENRVHGPRKGGPTFLAQIVTKNGTDVQLLTNTAGAIEMWAFSTTVSDTMIRGRLYSELGPARARQVLADKYPGGSAADDVERRRLNLKDLGTLTDSQERGVIDQIVSELLAYARR